MVVANIPVPLTSFIGREGDIGAVCFRLGSTRLLSLLGPGGAGKSRLAAEVATRVADEFPDGVWFVELSSTSSRLEVLSAVSRSLEVTEVAGRAPEDGLIEQLGERRALIVLDNCEHVTETVADLVVKLLASCPGLSLLVTSRQRLAVGPEVVWPVHGLDLPRSQPRTSATTDAMVLFAERCGAVNPAFRLSDDNVGAVAEICRTLDGLPLAIELAAARSNVFSASEIAERLVDAIDFLAPTTRGGTDRHASIGAAVSWSFSMLTEAERSTICRLGVFSGSFDAEAAARVSAPELPQSRFDEELASLVDKSLVVRLPGTGAATRYRMLETVRQYATDRLEEAGSLEAVRHRHAELFAELAEELWPIMWTGDQIAALDRIEADHDNLRSALRFAVSSGDTELAHRIAGWMARFWDLRGHRVEGLEWLERVMAMPGEVDPALRVQVMNGLTTLAVLSGEIERAIAVGTEAADLAGANDDRLGRAYALHYVGISYIFALDNRSARKALEESVVEAEKVGFAWLSGWSSLILGAVAMEESDLPTLEQHLGVARRHLTDAGEREGLGWCAVGEAVHAFLEGRTDDAVGLLRSATDHFRPIRDVWGISTVGVAGAQLWLALGESDEATQVLAWSELILLSIGGVHLPFFARWVEEGCDAARTSLGSTMFERLWASACDVAVDDTAELIDESVSRLEQAVVGEDEAPSDGYSREPTARVAILRDDGDVWTLAFAGEEHRLRPLVGLRHIATLLERPGVECSSIELATADVVPLGHPPAVDRTIRRRWRDDGDLVADARAIREYRARIAQLETELEQAEAWSDQARAEGLRAELDLLVEALGSAVGLSGRPRRDPSTAERARSTVTKAIRSAIRRIGDVDETLGRHLETSITTGSFCAYRPDPATTIRWRIER